MFNFLFEGKLGELLAPNSQNPLMTAIQRNEQDVIQNLVASASTIELCRTDECGYAPIHAACRYNNQFALQLIFGRGVHVEQPDRNGSTPLHYASKYGHLELCKHLVERGAFPARKNALNQTPYDLAESHLVRQFLLPLQFVAEREASESRMRSDSSSGGGAGGMMSNNYSPYAVPTNYSSHGIDVNSAQPPNMMMMGTGAMMGPGQQQTAFMSPSQQQNETSPGNAGHYAASSTSPSINYAPRSSHAAGSSSNTIGGIQPGALHPLPLLRNLFLTIFLQTALALRPPTRF